MPPKFRIIRQWLREDGYRLIQQEGSHEQFAHPAKSGRVTVAGKDREDAPIGIWKSIRRQAHWDEEGKHEL